MPKSTIALLSLALSATHPPPSLIKVELYAPAHLLTGERPHIQVYGLRPYSAVTVESFRIHPTPLKVAGAWSNQPLVYHATATFWADAAGRVNLDKTPPVSGTYSGADPRGLFWSGAVAGRGDEPALAPASPELADLQDRQVRLQVREEGRIVARRDVAIDSYRSGLTFATVNTPALVGVFAAPKGARSAPTVVLLHGSEGGDFAAAKATAGLWASHGYAAFALIYFAWNYAHVPNAPSAFAHLPIERLAATRDWLRGRPEADLRRLSVVGGSKGAEFALLGASHYPWIRAVVACVPSSLVWGGFGAPGHPDSFTWDGAPVANVSYGDYGPVERGEITSAERHRRDRQAAGPDAVARAAIPVERSRARLLLISGGRDAVWPSDAMSAEITDRMAAAGSGGRVSWRSFPDAGHFLCGTGDNPIRADENDEPARGGGLISEDGRDPGLAWEATLGFIAGAQHPSGTR